MMAAADQRRVLIVAGEASGDLHGAKIIRAARDIDPGLCFFGMGGRRMAEAGCEIQIDMRKLAVMGLVEVATRLPAIRRAFKSLKTCLSGASRPDLLVLIDYPGFNLRLAKAARQAEVPVLYYICPKIWASRPGRIRQIVHDVDRLATIFPFEAELFRGQPLKIDYVGNPLFDEYHPPLSRRDVLRNHGLDPQRPVVGLFTGSRGSEIKYILPTILETGKLLLNRLPGVQFLVPVAENLDQDELAAIFSNSGLSAFLLRGDIYDLSAACDAILSVSGTVTLQVALAGTPMAILYKVAPLTYAIGRRLVRIPLVGLPNIVAGKEVVREFIQDAAEPAALAAELRRILTDRGYREQMVAELAAVKSRLGSPGTAQKMAAIIQEMVN